MLLFVYLFTLVCFVLVEVGTGPEEERTLAPCYEARRQEFATSPLHPNCPEFPTSSPHLPARLAWLSTRL